MNSIYENLWYFFLPNSAFNFNFSLLSQRLKNLQSGCIVELTENLKLCLHTINRSTIFRLDQHKNKVSCYFALIMYTDIK